MRKALKWWFGSAIAGPQHGKQEQCQSGTGAPGTAQEAEEGTWAGQLAAVPRLTGAQRRGIPGLMAAALVCPPRSVATCGARPGVSAGPSAVPSSGCTVRGVAVWCPRPRTCPGCPTRSRTGRPIRSRRYRWSLIRSSRARSSTARGCCTTRRGRRSHRRLPPAEPPPCEGPAFPPVALPPAPPVALAVCVLAVVLPSGVVVAGSLMPIGPVVQRRWRYRRVQALPRVQRQAALLRLRSRERSMFLIVKLPTLDKTSE